MVNIVYFNIVCGIVDFRVYIYCYMKIINLFQKGYEIGLFK